MSTAAQLNLTIIHLVGSLGRAIGHKTLTLDVASPAEAIRAINVITNGKLERYLRGPGAKRYYRVAVQKKDAVLNKDELGNRSGRAEIWIMPTIRGSDSAGKKIIAGLALIAIAFVAPALGASFLTKTFAGVTIQGMMVSYGVALTLGGIAQALTPTAQGPTQGESAADRGSSIFQGNAVAVAQGIAVPLVYGRALVPAIPISISVSNNDVSLSDAGQEGTVEAVPLPGGGIQYGPGRLEGELD